MRQELLPAVNRRRSSRAHVMRRSGRGTPSFVPESPVERPRAAPLPRQSANSRPGLARIGRVRAAAVFEVDQLVAVVVEPVAACRGRLGLVVVTRGLATR